MLAEWESAWSGDGPVTGLFAPALLDVPELTFLRADRSGAIVAGAVVNRSRHVAGVSNVFTTSGEPSGVWTGCIRAISARLPGVDLVGYESGRALDDARRVGFRVIGPLRVWVRE